VAKVLVFGFSRLNGFSRLRFFSRLRKFSRTGFISQIDAIFFEVFPLSAHFSVVNATSYDKFAIRLRRIFYAMIGLHNVKCLKNT
jgi:hypothetical protein